MKHYGDITKLRGYDMPIVDIITGGSPCQDLSVAGKREGLKGERSGLFMDQIRIVKELRQCDEWRNRKTGRDIRPRYMVWEIVLHYRFGDGWQQGLCHICKMGRNALLWRAYLMVSVDFLWSLAVWDASRYFHQKLKNFQ